MWGRADRTGEWSFGENTDFIYAYAQVSPHLVCVAHFEGGSIDFVFRCCPNPRRMLKKLDRWEYDSSYRLDIVLKLEVVVYDQFGRSQGDRCSEVFAHRVIDQKQWNMVALAVGSWHERCMAVKGQSPLPSEDYVHPVISISATEIGMILRGGFDDFLSDESISEVSRSMMFLSALATTGRYFTPIDGESICRLRCLSAAMCRSIVKTNPVEGLIGSDDAFLRGFRLALPVFNENTLNSGRYRWQESMYHMTDSKYKFVSLAGARMIGVEVSADNNYVIPRTPECDPDLPYNDLARWYDSMFAVPMIDDALLTSIGHLSQDKAIQLGHMISTMANSASFFKSHDSTAQAKTLALKLAVFMAESGYGPWVPTGSPNWSKGECRQPWNTPWMMPLLGGRNEAESSEWGGLVRGVLFDMMSNERMLTMESYVLTGIIYAILVQPVRDSRFIDALNFWTDERVLSGDYMATFRQMKAYLAESVNSDDDAIPFSWWLNLNIGN